MRKFLIRSRTITKKHAIPARRRRSTRRPAVEGLEERLCLSGFLLVSSYANDSVIRYDENTGAYVDTPVPSRSGGLREPMGVLLGPDGRLDVSSGAFSDSGNGHKAVLQYSGTTGTFLSDFADGNQLTSPRGIIFGPDGNLYVADGKGPGTVVRYNGTTGAFMNDFVATGSGGFAHPGALVFGPDGDLYAGSFDQSQILRYEGPAGPNPGAFLGTFVTPGSGGLKTPQMMVFGPDGDLYVASGNFVGSPTFTPGNVLRYEGPGGPNPGAFLGTFIAGGSGGLSTPVGMLFGPDGRNDGQLDLYVTSAVGSSVPDHGKLKFSAAPGTSEVLRYDGTTGAFLDTFVAPDSGGLSFPTFMTFTETDPTTLNYDGGGASAATAAVKPQATAGIPTLTVSGPSLPGGPLLASPPSGGARPGLAALPDSLWDRPSSVAPPSAASPVGPAAPVPPLVPSVVGDLPDEGHGADRSLTSRKSRSAADRLLAGLDIRQFLDPPAVAPATALRS